LRGKKNYKKRGNEFPHRRTDQAKPGGEAAQGIEAVSFFSGYAGKKDTSG
jgi:hypothetical protein